MEAPVRGIRFIHRALAREVEDIDALARSGTSGDALADRIAWYAGISKIHHKGCTR